MSRRRQTTTAPVLVVVALLVTSCRATAPAVVTPLPVGDLFAEGAVDPVEARPSGLVRVAYPEQPASMLDEVGDDPAAADMNTLWGLPLFRRDADGQLEPGLVRAWTVEDDAERWAVRLELAAGEWSDGRAVDAGDVVATVAALRDGPRSRELRPLLTVERRSASVAVLRFDRPYARWPELLDGIGVLPAHVVADGLGQYRDEVPVSGGAFQVAEIDPGRSMTFVAHPGSPLGPPGVERLEVLVVPRFEAALGLLDQGGAEVALGYLAVNGAGRAAQVEGVTADDAVGGTWVGLVWPGGGDVDADVRRSVQAAIEVGELVEGLLGDEAKLLDTPFPLVPATTPASSPETDVPDLVLLWPRWHETVAVTSRIIQRDLADVGSAISLVSEPSPGFVPAARSEADLSLRVHRTGPRPTLTRWVLGEEDTELALAADAAGGPGPVRDHALARVASSALVTPLYRPPVTHAWTAAMAGVEASAWAGMGFAQAHRWVRTDATQAPS